MTSDTPPPPSEEQQFLTRSDARKLLSEIVHNSQSDIFVYEHAKRILRIVGLITFSIVSGIFLFLSWFGIDSVRDFEAELTQDITNLAREEVSIYIANRHDIIDEAIEKQVDETLPGLIEERVDTQILPTLTINSEEVIENAIHQIDEYRSEALNETEQRFLTIFPAIRSLERLQEQGIDIGSAIASITLDLENQEFVNERLTLELRDAFNQIEGMRGEEIEQLRVQLFEQQQIIGMAEQRIVEMSNDIAFVEQNSSDINALREIADASCFLFFAIPQRALLDALNPNPPDAYPELDSTIQNAYAILDEVCFPWSPL